MATLDRLGPAPATAQPPATWRPRRAIAVAFATAAAIALLQVLQSSNFANTGQQLQRLEAERAALKAEVFDLQAEVAGLASLERTERVAREELGMIRARNVSYLSVGVESPEGALLPRPLVEPVVSEPEAEPWWVSLYKALPFP
jgi:cell division protein FtsL